MSYRDDVFGNLGDKCLALVRGIGDPSPHLCDDLFIPLQLIEGAVVLEELTPARFVGGTEGRTAIARSWDMSRAVLPRSRFGSLPSSAAGSDFHRRRFSGSPTRPETPRINGPVLCEACDMHSRSTLFSRLRDHRRQRRAST